MTARRPKLLLFALACVVLVVCEAREEQRPGTVPSNPIAHFRLNAAERQPFSGAVQARLDAGPYRYLQVHPDDGGAPVWVATLALAEPGDVHVRVSPIARAAQFHSSRLQRDFAPLWFGRISSMEKE